MDKGRIIHSVLPLRAEPSHRSEMVSQLLFGETYEVLNSKDEWMLIRSHSDQYEGYLPIEYFTELGTETDSKTLRAMGARLVNVDQSAHIVLHPGSIIYGASYDILGEEYHLDMSGAHEVTDPIEFCLNLINTPYLWGGRTPHGIDCSGLMQIAFKMKGIDLPRDAYQQAEKGHDVSFKDAGPGDLAFFIDKDEKVTHVGLVLQSNKIVHAAVHVRVDDLTPLGIRRLSDEEQSHLLHSIKRITS